MCPNPNFLHFFLSFCFPPLLQPPALFSLSYFTFFPSIFTTHINLFFYLFSVSSIEHKLFWDQGFVLVTALTCAWEIEHNKYLLKEWKKQKFFSWSL